MWLPPAKKEISMRSIQQREFAPLFQDLAKRNAEPAPREDVDAILKLAESVERLANAISEINPGKPFVAPPRSTALVPTNCHQLNLDEHDEQ